MSLVPIPKLYWDTFLLVLKQNSEKLVREVADVLGENPSPLLDSIRNNTVGVYIYDEAANSEVDIESMRCKHLVHRPDAPLIYVPCMNPVVWSSTPGSSMNVCVEHSTAESIDYCAARYIQHSSDEILYVNESYLYTKDIDLIGRYNEAKGTLIKFKNITTK